MVVGILQIELGHPGRLLAEGQAAVGAELKDRIGRNHNVSVAEVGALEQHRRSILAVAMVSNDKVYVERRAEQVGRHGAGDADGRVADHQIDFL
jgi:uncharacterized protein YlxP (DUF503 family)